MAKFAETQTQAAQSVFEKEVLPNLAPKDGKTHVMMINSFSKWLNQNFGVETKYTTQIDTILTLMQRYDCEIIDVKFNALKGQGITGTMEGFHTLITYR